MSFAGTAVAVGFIRSWIEQSVTLATEPDPDSEKNRHEISARLTVLRNAALLLERAEIPWFDSGGISTSQADRLNLTGDDHLPGSGGREYSAATDISRTPKAFISYAWESDEHRAWVRDLASRLRADGVDVRLDRWHLAHGDQLPSFMEREVRDNDFVLVICTPHYRERSNARMGGVGYEGDVMTGEVCVGGNHRKFIPILRLGPWTDAAPSWLLGKIYVNLAGNPYSEIQYQELLQTLHGAREEPPPVGTRPDFGRSSAERGSARSSALERATQLARESEAAEERRRRENSAQGVTAAITELAALSEALRRRAAEIGAATRYPATVDDGGWATWASRFGRVSTTLKWDAPYANSLKGAALVVKEWDFPYSFQGYRVSGDPEPVGTHAYNLMLNVAGEWRWAEEDGSNIYTSDELAEEIWSSLVERGFTP